MKKKTIIIVILLVLIVLTSLIVINIKRVQINTNSKVILVYKYSDKDIDVELTEEESNKIIELFNGKVLLKDNPSCGFDKDVSFIINGNYYEIAEDGCGIIYSDRENRYIRLSNKEKEIYKEIMDKYGAKCPCV